MNAIRDIIDYAPQLLPDWPFEDEQNKIIKEIAITSLKELGTSLAFAGVTCFFVATPAGIAIAVGGAVAMVAINAVYRGIEAVFTSSLAELEGVQDADAESERFFLRMMTKAASLLRPLGFATFYSGTAGIVIHESGHALIATLLTNSPVHVSVDPLQGGMTRGHFRNLSPTGKLLGMNKSQLAITAAGTLFTLMASIGLLIGAHFLADSHPELSLYLNAMGMMGLFSEITYALSALFVSFAAEMAGHDFFALWVGGIHPIVPVLIMILLPLCIKGILLAIK